MAVVLVVEDDQVSQKVLGKMLRNEGHEALLSHNLTTASDLLRQHVLVDLVILDSQLGRDWGWEFLRELRNDPVFAGIPVVVYTGNSERSSLVRYVELGVQGVRLKPYQAEVVLAELDKAVKTNWAAGLVEGIGEVSARLKLTPTDYCGLLNAAVPMIEKSLLEVRRRLILHNDPLLWAHLDEIKSRGLSLGINVISAIVQSTGAAIRREDHAKAAAALRSIEPLLGILRKRALAALSMTDAVAPFQKHTASASSAKIRPMVAPPASLVAAYCRKMAACPVWQLGTHFARLRQAGLISPEELDRMGRGLLSAPPFTALFAAVKLLQRIPDATSADLTEIVFQQRRFPESYKRILNHLDPKGHAVVTPATTPGLIDRQGSSKAGALIAAGLLADALNPSTPLDTEPLFEHAIAVSLLSYEIGRMLKLSNAHLLAAAGLVHDLGKWVFAFGEPGLYAVVLGIGQTGDTDMEAAEKDIFGLDHHEAGKALLAAAGENALLQAVALSHSDPSAVTSADHEITVAVVHLANLLAHAATAENGAHRDEIHKHFQNPAHPVWKILRNHGVELPFDEQEIVTLIASIAQTVQWIGVELCTLR